MGFFYSQLFKTMPPPTGNYSGKTIIITGSNVGLGKEAARHFARLSAKRIILAVRSMDKGEAAKQDILNSLPPPQTVDIQVWQLDMASYANVQKFAARVNSELDRLDMFLANAGIASGEYRVIEDNESMITVNVVSTFLLAALVLPKLKESAARFGIRPALTITSSDVHGHAPGFVEHAAASAAANQSVFALANDKAVAEKNWDEQYPISKLLEVLAVRAIAEQSPADKFPVTINTVNPGLCHSELSRESPGWGFWLMRQIIARSAEAGSRNLVHAASKGAESHGQYVTDCEVSEPAALATGEKGKIVQDKMWKELVKKLETIKPGISLQFSS
ncbi:Short chain dehydrogenase/reductase dmxR8 [Conoideocrella luteorostrata]|uniref:Short chain dehydrogenase/reductase dmxR8 n=1 Tax=Conoideocrella luteorostrata TaxID=1105319 RepID=A0AAJ0CFK0_9HYPO|nr:Short chain dehydrogenase/reductase dmxR8 [Conoideocrella luteorostrata]